ncbi:hypothetical protein Shell_0695 [Staphylothermus hellenicus DSM 12710]|uniref:YjbQ family protein n=1 Tax=Staphylothermus hellenicus (strain DSM 12710 / JCM 10830 / BK20S6-10-b1 / P8) TaxID=591019 RepID=D7DCB9_STAHD|nr:hypothetical protein Shell_0695 [Staphylothermus hellenicus DSM 12710]
MKVKLVNLVIRTFGPMKYFPLRRIIEEEIEDTDTNRGVATIHAKGATPGIIVISKDDLDYFDQIIKNIIPITGWKHGNAYAHLRSTIMSTTQTIYYENKKLYMPDNYEVYFVETRPVHNHRRTIHLIIHGI